MSVCWVRKFDIFSLLEKKNKNEQIQTLTYLYIIKKHTFNMPVNVCVCSYLLTVAVIIVYTQFSTCYLKWKNLIIYNSLKIKTVWFVSKIKFSLFCSHFLSISRWKLPENIINWILKNLNTIQWRKSLLGVSFQKFNFFGI